MAYDEETDANFEPERRTVSVVASKVVHVARLDPRWEQWRWEDSPANAEVVKGVRLWARHPAPLGLCLYGPSRTGKTGLATLAAVTRINRGEDAPVHDLQLAGGNWTAWHLHAGSLVPDTPEWRATWDAHVKRGERFAPVTVLTWIELESILRRAMEGHRFDTAMDAVQEQVGCLVLDDVDVNTSTNWREAILYQLFERPNHGRKLIVTMNRAPEAATDALTDRLISRLLSKEMFLTVAVHP